MYTDDRTCESDSITNQKKYIEEFVAKNPDIEVVDVKVDDGYSGIVFDRPAFKEMMEDIKNGSDITPAMFLFCCLCIPTYSFLPNFFLAQPN